ncbi:MAG: DUF1573 domain-containing protein [Tannerellaceae bacterium]|jgi:hypothetical protein|nr:DUF1573 domain-containing protein [Tannerellaceae bacterium]
MFNTRQLIRSIVISLFTVSSLFAQKEAMISADMQTYDFGVVQENEGVVSHVFHITNTGTDPLVITRITTSCGCTQPEWTKTPIEPGMTGEITIRYNPKGRPGPFHKQVSVFSNAKNGSLTLYVQGAVTSKPAAPVIRYPYTIGGLKLQTKSLLYAAIRPDEALSEKIAIKNESETSLVIRAGSIPHYLIAEVRPTTLEPGETGEITCLLNAREAKRMGRVTTVLPLTVESADNTAVPGEIHVAANIIDNFTKLSASDRTKAPVAQCSAVEIDFGKLPERGSRIPLIGRKESESFDITNAGKSPLSVYSVTCDNELVDISGGKKVLKPGASATYKITVRPKEIKTKLETQIHVVTNDPGTPVRLIKVVAEK